MKKIVAFGLILFLVSPVLAADISSLNLPSIQSIGASEKALPQQSQEMVMESPIDPDSYRVGPGDVLAIHIIVGDSELTVDHNLAVGADGKIFFPNIGEIVLSGLSLTQAKQKLQSSIRSSYKESFKLSLLLSQPKKVKIYLTGMVLKPGPIAVYDSSRVSEVIAAAGGTVSGASNRYVYIKRMSTSGEEKIIMADLFEAYRSRDVSKDIRVQAGDIVEVPDAANERISQGKPTNGEGKLLFEGKETFVYVYGEVNRSGRFEYVPGRRVSDYISYAGGPTSKALLGSVSLTRQENGKAKKYGLDVSDILYNGNSRNDIEVNGGDVINVPGNFFYFSDFASFVNTVLLGLTLYNTVAK
jgi:polysaccharide export outer membrane protein